MNILVTGSSGRIGRAIINRLMRNHKVIGYDLTPTSVTHVIADINDQDRLSEAMRGADAVIHTAALHAPHVPHRSVADFEMVNLEGTRSVITCCLENKVRNLVFTSTTALYGSASTPSDHAGWVDEDLPPQPGTIYHRTKMAGENMLKDASANNDLNVTVVRMSRCFPEPAPLMAAYRIHRGVDARDVASAHELALLSNDQPYRTFVASGTTPFEKEDIEPLKNNAPAVIQKRAPELARCFEERGWGLPDTIDRVYSSEKAQKELGWKPHHGFDSVIQQYEDGSSEVLPPIEGWSAED